MPPATESRVIPRMGVYLCPVLGERCQIRRGTVCEAEDGEGEEQCVHSGVASEPCHASRHSPPCKRSTRMQMYRVHYDTQSWRHQEGTGAGVRGCVVQRWVHLCRLFVCVVSKEWKIRHPLAQALVGDYHAQG